MTSFLSKQRPGGRQYKIRGPFGNSMLKEIQLDGTVKLMPDHLIFIGAGTGITPFLQIVNLLVLPQHEPLKVVSDYMPGRGDELSLSKSQPVIALEHYCIIFIIFIFIFTVDGWAYGKNLTTGKVGVFPLSVTSPRIGRKFRITLVNCVSSTSDIIGLESLEGAMIVRISCDFLIIFRRHTPIELLLIIS